MLNHSRRRVVFASLVALGASVMAFAGPQLVSAAPTCSISWVAPVSGQWTEPLMWNQNRVPDSTDNACIQVAGTYTVTLGSDQTIASLQIGGATGTQTLLLNGTPGWEAHPNVTSEILIGSNAVVTLTSSGGSSTATLGSWTSVITNAGTINSLPGTGGSRAINGDLDNTGDINVSANTAYVNGPHTFTNHSTLDLTAQFSVFSSTSFTNAAGGSVNATGAGELNEGSGTFTQGAGITTGNPVQIDSGATLNFTGSGASAFSVYTSARLKGTSVAGQTVYVREGAPYSEARYIDGFTNGGVITLSSTVGADNAALVPDVDGSTIHNTGTINVLPGTGGGRILAGNIDNTGDINVSANSQYVYGPSTFTNKGTLDLTAQLSVFSSTNFTNAAGGSVNATGVGELNESSGTFTQGAGVTTGNPVQIDSSAILNFTGSGSSTFSVYGTAKLKGTSVPGQTIYVREGAPYSDARFIDGFTNGGVITLSSTVGADNAALEPDVSGGTIHNTGTINVLPGTGGGRILAGNIDNSGHVNVSVYTQYVYGPATFTNRGVLSLSAQLAVFDSASFANAAAGTLQINIASGSNYGKLDANTPVTLAGTLATITSYSPAAGATFTAMTFPSRTGSFTSTSFAGGTNYTVNQHAGDVQLVAQASSAVRKPDGWIRIAPSGAYVGNNIYNTTAKNQSKSKSSARNTTVTFDLNVQNDGSAADSFKVSGLASKAGYTVTYMSGATDITSAVVAGTYTTASLAPGQSAVVTVKVAVNSNAAAGSKVARVVTITSVGAPTKKDAVKFIVKRS
jgi:hypothetical protein